MLTFISAPLEQFHFVLFEAGRFVLTIAAMLFLAYAVFMTTVFTVSAMWGWVQPALSSSQPHRRNQLSLIPLAEGS